MQGYFKVDVKGAMVKSRRSAGNDEKTISICADRSMRANSPNSALAPQGLCEKNPGGPGVFWALMGLAAQAFGQYVAQRGGGVAQHFLGGGPIDAGVGDRAAVLQLG